MLKMVSIVKWRVVVMMLECREVWECRRAEGNFMLLLRQTCTASSIMIHTHQTRTTAEHVYTDDVGEGFTVSIKAVS